MKHLWRDRVSTMKAMKRTDRHSWTECSWCRDKQTEDNKDQECKMRTEVKHNGGWVGKE